MTKLISEILKVGDVMSSNSYGDFKVIEVKTSRDVLIKFVGTGYERSARASDLKNGEVSDPLVPIVCGIGYFGVGSHLRYKDGKHTDSYSTWKNMLRRCYVETEAWYHAYGGRGISVCEDWCDFQNFASWYEPRYFIGCQLDKDLLCKSSKVYSPETCTLLPKKVNIVISPKKRKTSDLPMGVRLNVKSKINKQGQKFLAGISMNRKTYELGCFDSSHLAFMRYKEVKEGYIKKVADEEFKKGSIGASTHQALMNWEVYPY